MSGQSVNLTTLFQDRLRPPITESLEGKNDRRKNFMIDFHDSMWPDHLTSTNNFFLNMVHLMALIVEQFVFTIQLCIQKE